MQITNWSNWKEELPNFNSEALCKYY